MSTPRSMTAPAVATRLPPRLLALIGERIASTASALLPMLTSADAQGRLAADGLGRLGLQLQQVEHMVAHAGTVAPEAVDLLAACQQAAAGWQAEADARKLPLMVSGAPSSTMLNAAALAQTLDLLIEHGLDCGERVTLEVLALQGPLRPGVRVSIHRRELPAIDAMSPPRDVDELLPMLAMWLARSCGLMLEPLRAGKLVTLLLSLPVPEDPALDDGALLPRTPLAVGRRVLIVDPNSASRLKAHKLLHDIGMLVDAVVNVAQARVALLDGAPDVLLSGLDTHGPEMAELVDDMRAASPALRVIELVDAENAFAFSMPAADRPGRLSRDELEAHLTMAVSEEVYGARPG